MRFRHRRRTIVVDDVRWQGVTRALCLCVLQLHTDVCKLYTVSGPQPTAGETQGPICVMGKGERPINWAVPRWVEWVWDTDSDTATCAVGVLRCEAAHPDIRLRACVQLTK